MSVEVYISVILREACGGKSLFQLEADTVSAIIDAINSDYPGFRQHVLTEDDGVREGVRVSINGEDVAALSGVGTRLRPGDHVFLLVGIAGG